MLQVVLEWQPPGVRAMDIYTTSAPKELPITSWSTGGVYISLPWEGNIYTTSAPAAAGQPPGSTGGVPIHGPDTNTHK